MSVALVLGAAAGVWSEVAALRLMGDWAGLVACNDAAAAWPGSIDAAVSYHPEEWPLRLKRRALAGFPPPVLVIGHQEAQGAWRRLLGRDDIRYLDPRFPSQTGCGASGLFALKVALLDLGFDKAVLCGVPMDDRRHFNDRAPWGAAYEHRPAWLEALPEIRDRARSMSGWTKQLLGKPTADWLTG